MKEPLDTISTYHSFIGCGADLRPRTCIIEYIEIFCRTYKKHFCNYPIRFKENNKKFKVCDVIVFDECFVLSEADLSYLNIVL